MGSAVLIYVQHLLGIGHLMRARALAEAIAGRGFDVHLVTGGMPIGGRLPRGVHTIQLPPIRVSDASFNPLRDGAFTPIDDAYRERRRTLLLEAFDRAQPSAVLFETFPFGRRALRFELFPLLERIDAARPRPLVISSIREILQLAPKEEREREMVDWAARWFDAIFVHGDPRFARFEDTFPFVDALTPPVHYTGFVRNDDAQGHAREGVRDEVVVSAGGGAVGIELLATALAAQRLSRFGHLTWRVLAGPNIADAGLERLRHASLPNAIVERSRIDFAALLRRAFVSISQAGYNTTMDVMGSGARPVVVPFTGRGETEQRARGERLAAFGLAVVVDDRSLTPERLAAAVDDAGTRDAFARWDFASDGATRTADLVVELLDAHGREPAKSAA
ncbi:MAG TPA: glycosyltransferase [Casimicrobiaceae bacterium]|nr:glycosyltransferase [Casimicrobiaceae bacterium]